MTRLAPLFPAMIAFAFGIFLLFKLVILPWRRRRRRDTQPPDAEAAEVVAIPLTRWWRDRGYETANVNGTEMVRKRVVNREIYDPGFAAKYRDLLVLWAYYCPECGNRLASGPEGGLSVNIVCKVCRINYGCRDGSEHNFH